MFACQIWSKLSIKTGNGETAIAWKPSTYTPHRLHARARQTPASCLMHDAGMISNFSKPNNEYFPPYQIIHFKRICARPSGLRVRKLFVHLFVYATTDLCLMKNFCFLLHSALQRRGKRRQDELKCHLDRFPRLCWLGNNVLWSYEKHTLVQLQSQILFNMVKSK